MILTLISGQHSRALWFAHDSKLFIQRILGTYKKVPEDEIVFRVENSNQIADIFKRIIVGSDFNIVLDFLGSITNDQHVAANFGHKVASLFDRHVAAYWLDTSKRPFRFFPRSSEEQGEATKQAIETIREGGMAGATTHLRKAVEQINAREYADSVRESIHAVESVARTLDPKASKTLGPALDSLERGGLLEHSVLKEAFKKLYGYANDEQGIRHPLLDKDSAGVGLDEAMFMFGACASFAAYLVSKHRQMEQDDTQ